MYIRRTHTNNSSTGERYYTYRLVATVIATRISGIRAAAPLTLDVAVLTAHQLQAMAQVNQLRTTLQAIAKLAPIRPVDTA